MDYADHAQELETHHRELALQHLQAGQRSHIESRTLCLDCQEPIPVLRQRLGGVLRCIDCAELYEMDKKNCSR